MENDNRIDKNNSSLGFIVPKKVMKPEIFFPGNKRIISQFLEIAPGIFQKFVNQYDNDRERFPGYYESCIKNCIKVLDKGVYIALKDYTGNLEIRSFALMSCSPIDILEVYINLITGDLSDFPKLLKSIIDQYNNSDCFNLFSYVPDNQEIIQIFLDTGFTQVDSFYGGIRHRMKYIKMNFRLTQIVYPPIDVEEEKKYSNFLDSLRKEYYEHNPR